jgi:aspartate/tyrosine/aromatic aminotransferase
VARRLGVPSLLLVLNRVPGGIDLDDLRSQMDAAYGAETAAILPMAEDVVRNASGGMFSLLGLDDAQLKRLRDEQAIYLVARGRINFAGLSAVKIPIVAKAVAALLR